MITAPTTTPQEGFPRTYHIRRYGKRHGAVIFIYFLTLALFVVAASISPSFRQFSNITDILRQSIVLGLVTVGQSFVLIGGGIDMSVGMSARVVGLLVAVMLGTTMAPVLVILLGIACGMAVGLVNGVVITRTGAAPFIVTLGMFSVLQGLALAITSGPTNLAPNWLLGTYSNSISEVPYAVLVMAVVWLFSWVVLNRTRFGRDVYAVGGSQQVARLAAIKVDRTQIKTYVISGIFAALAGMFLLAQSGVGDPNMANGLEFQSIVAAAIGGVSVFGGRGSVVGAAGAVLLITLTDNIFNFLNISGNYQNLTFGVIVLIGVATYRSKP